MYYANLEFPARGSLRQLPLSGNAFLNSVPVNVKAPLPRAVEAVLNTAIAPGWLDTVSLKWVEWSTVTRIPLILGIDSGPLKAGRVLFTLDAFFKDGWTLSNTLTHRLSDNLALSLRLGWDRGVSTGWTDNSDAWQAVGFANYKLNEHVELTAGLGVFFLAAGEIDKSPRAGASTRDSVRAPCSSHMPE
jgi:long-chain fatty acid transport protein